MSASIETPRRSVFVETLFHPAWLCFLLGAITLAVFWPAVNSDFISYDDPSYFVENSHVQNGLSRDGVAWAFSTRWMGNWNPAIWLSYMLDVALFGKGPSGPHFTNVLLHAANAALLLLVLYRFTGARRRSLMVAALFALHPLRVESVAWISERKDVLSALFGLLALLAYERHARHSTSRESRAPIFRSRGYWLALFFFALALMSKPMLVTLPFVMLLLDYWPLQRIPTEHQQRSFARLVAEKIPFFLFGLIVGALTFGAHKSAGALTSWADASITARLANAFVACASYLGRTFCPMNMVLPYPRVDHWPVSVVIASTILVTGASLAAVWLGRKQPHLFVGWFWFLGMLVPVSGIIQWGDQAMADRFTYLPSIGLFIFLIWVISDAASDARLPEKAAVVPVALILGACALVTRNQLAYWRNSETLFSHTLSITQNNFVASCNLGMFRVKQGRYEEAAACFATALEANPDYAPALNNLGAALCHNGRVNDAAVFIQKAIQIEPDYVSAHVNLGQVRVAQGRLDDAVGCFDTALHFDPEYFAAHKNLAAVLLRQGKADAALPHLQFALRRSPDDVEILSNLGSALASMGQLDEAIANFRQAVRCAPNLADTHFNLASALAAQHRRDEAIAEFQLALRLQPDHAAAKQQLRALGVDTAE